MMMDELGFLWFTTEKGVTRYDGNNFKNYYGSDINNTGGRRMSHIYRLGDSLIFFLRTHLWVHQGKLHIDTTRNVIEHLLQTRHQTLVDTRNSQIPGIRQTEHGSFATGELLVYIDHDHFYRREGDQLYYYDHGQPQKVPKNIPRTDKFLVVNGYLFLFEDGILYQLKGAQLIHSYDATFLGPNPGLIWNYGSNKSYIYSSTLRCLFRVIATNDRPCLQLLTENLRVQGINRIIEKDSGNFYWIGTSNEGLFQLQRKSFSTWYSEKFPTTNSIRSIWEIGMDSVITGRNVILTPNNSFQAPKDSTGLKMLVGQSSVSHTFHLKQGNLVLYRRGPDEPVEVTTSLHRRMLIDSKERIWGIGTGSIHLLQNNKWVDYDFEALKDLGLEEDRIFHNPFTKELWIVTHDYRILRLSSDLKLIGEITGVPSTEITEMFFSKEGITWILSRDVGFYLHKGNETMPLPLDPKKHLQYAHCMITDDLGYHWLSSDYGLFRISSGWVDNYFENPEMELVYDFFDKSHGFRNSEFNGRGSPCAIKLRDGKLGFPSFRGMVVFDPAKIVEPLLGNGLIIDDIKVDGKDTTAIEKMVLDQNFKELEFQVYHAGYGYNDYSNAHYILEGYHNSWQKLPIDGRISFSRLRYGNYKFKVRKKLDHTGLNEVLVTLPIKVNKRLYQTTPFIASIVLIFFLLIYLSVVTRVRTLRRRQVELQKIIREKTKEYQLLNEELKLNISRLRESEEEQRQTIRVKDRMLGIYTHDIRGPLRFIMTIAEKSVMAIKELKEKDIIHYFNTIRESTKGIYRQTESMFNWSNLNEEGFTMPVQKIDLKPVIEECLRHFNGQAGEKNISLISEVNAPFLLMAELNVLQIMINNIIQNAIKFTEDGVITFRATRVPDYVVIAIRDTGVGIEEDQLKRLNIGKYKSTPGTDQEDGKGYGLKVIRDFLKKMKGFMQIESQPGKGTTVRLFLPDKGSVDNSK